MERTKIVELIEKSGVVAVIRMDDTAKLKNVIAAISAGGVKALEITMTTPNAVQIIHEISSELDEEFVVGAGTVLDAETARAVILAGAQFVVSPVLNPDVIRLSHRYDKPVFPGAFTPTEILTAWEAGADIVKVFPATALGPKFFKDVKGPLPQVKLTPTGGVCLDNAAEFIRCGASCLGVGTALLNKKMIAEDDWEGLTEHARKFVDQVALGRS